MKKLPGYVRAAQEECVSFFFTNFSQEENTRGLRQVFVAFGSIGDLFIPVNKNTHLGQRFGFVRLRGVLEVDGLLNKLQDIWLRGYNLKVNVSKFGRDSHKPSSSKKSICKTFKEGIAEVHPGRYFLDAVSNRTGTSKSIFLADIRDCELPSPPLRNLVFDVDSARLQILKKFLGDIS
jgi:hypothetical protein